VENLDKKLKDVKAKKIDGFVGEAGKNPSEIKFAGQC